MQLDRAGEEIITLLQKSGIDSGQLINDPNKPTTVKTRVIGQKQQMLRIDREDSACCKKTTIDMLCANIEQTLDSASALIISDYAKGVISPHVMEHVRKICKIKRIPWIIDPKQNQLELYYGATMMTPNIKELESLSTMSSKNDLEIVAASQHLVKKLNLQGLLVTRSEKGMALFHANHSNVVPHFIPAEAKEVFDISGAGDTVIAIFSAAISIGLDWENAAMLANTAAGIVVSKMGTATVTPEEIIQYYKNHKII